MRVYLIGFMGCGKSTIGKRLSKKFNFSFIDTDIVFEEKYKISVSNFFDKYGENHFRELERAILLSTINKENTIISTGGGTPCFFDNIDFINKNGISFYIKMTPESLKIRLLNSKTKRPLIIKHDEDQLFEYIRTTLEQRESFYNKANYIVKGENLNIETIINILNKEIIPKNLLL